MRMVENPHADGLQIGAMRVTALDLFSMRRGRVEKHRARAPFTRHPLHKPDRGGECRMARTWRHSASRPGACSGRVLGRGRRAGALQAFHPFETWKDIGINGATAAIFRPSPPRGSVFACLHARGTTSAGAVIPSVPRNASRVRGLHTYTLGAARCLAGTVIGSIEPASTLFVVGRRPGEHPAASLEPATVLMTAEYGKVALSPGPSGGSRGPAAAGKV